MSGLSPIIHISYGLNILCNNEYPEFINKYLEVKELKRLKRIGQFCGCDYSKLFSINTWYSRFDHSISVALIVWNFTKDKKETLAALFHDLGTPAFSHCIDFLMGDSVNQESSERSVKDIILKSKQIIKLLKEDNISIEDVTDLSKYPVLENKSPKLCADRLDGVLHTVLIWIHTYSLEEIKEIFKGITILTNEEGIKELGFNKLDSALKFMDAVYQYSIVLQENEDKYIMSYFSTSIKKIVDLNIIKIDDLYLLNEKKIIELLEQNIKSFNLFRNSTKIIRSNKEHSKYFSVSLPTKKRFVMPLCKINNETPRLDKISKKVEELSNNYNNFKDTKYCYIENIDFN